MREVLEIHSGTTRSKAVAKTTKKAAPKKAAARTTKTKKAAE